MNFTFKVRPNLQEELETVFEGFAFSNGNISRSTSLADNLDQSTASRVSSKCKQPDLFNSPLLIAGSKGATAIQSGRL